MPFTTIDRYKYCFTYVIMKIHAQFILLSKIYKDSFIFGKECGGKMKHRAIHGLFLAILVPCFFIVSSSIGHAADNEIEFTAAEQEYIKQHREVRVVIVGGIAPLEFIDEHGEPKGIAVELYKRISELTGLKFVYEKERLASFEADKIADMGIDLMQVVPSQYLAGEFQGYAASPPLISCKTVLYVRKDLGTEKLENKIFGGNYGRPLPKGIKEDQVKYYWGREDSIQAVDSGEADFGYGNEYSVSYYIVRNGYRNVNIIPMKTESRDYVSIYLNPDERLHSIINKALASISPGDMQSIILLGCTQPERRITLLQVIDAYGFELLLILAVIILVLLICIAAILKTSRSLHMQNQRFLTLADISDEYIYEYDFQKDKLTLSDKCQQLFNSIAGMDDYQSRIKNGLLKLTVQPESVEDVMKAVIRDTKKSQEITIKLNNGDTGVFRITNSAVYSDNKRQLRYIVGKLTDISRDVSEREKLMEKSQLDSLTMLYNAQTVKELARQRFGTRGINEACALLIIDIDKFKNVNDTYGHVIGDEVIVVVAKLLKNYFGGDNLVGRIGGDEFFVYLQGDFTKTDLEHKLYKLYSYLRINEVMIKYQATLSAGGVFVACGLKSVRESEFVDIYKKADKQLYRAKENGRNNYKLTGWSS